jgi:hypothetical protein
MGSVADKTKIRIFRADFGNWLIRPRRGNVIAIYSFDLVCLPLRPLSFSRLVLSVL